MEDWITIREAAKRIDKTPQSIYKLVAAKRIASIKFDVPPFEDVLHVRHADLLCYERLPGGRPRKLLQVNDLPSEPKEAGS